MISVYTPRVYEFEVTLTEPMVDIEISFKKFDGTHGDDSSMDTIFSGHVTSMFLSRSNFVCSGDIHGDLVACDSTVEVSGKITRNKLTSLPLNSFRAPALNDALESTSVLLVRFRRPTVIRFTEGEGARQYQLTLKTVEVDGRIRNSTNTWVGNNVQLTVMGEVRSVSADSANVVTLSSVKGDVEVVGTFVRVKGDIRGTTTLITADGTSCDKRACVETWGHDKSCVEE
jgi:hypothetical protein